MLVCVSLPSLVWGGLGLRSVLAWAGCAINLEDAKGAVVLIKTESDS